MKTIRLKTMALALTGMLAISSSLVSCTKDKVEALTNIGNIATGVHKIDPKFVGKWMWTNSSDGAYYSDNGVYHGAQYGMASQYNINADGTGTAFNHIFSNIGIGVGLEVNISYKGFFESDDKGHMGFFPLSGTYQSSSGESRPLRADELWDVQKGAGKSFLYQKVTFTTQGGRQCFQTTASSGTVDTYFKVN